MKKDYKRLLVLISTLFVTAMIPCSFASADGLLPDVRIVPPDNDSFIRGNRIPISVTVERGEAIDKVLCYFRYGDSKYYYAMVMNLTGINTYNITLPAPANSIQRVDYFVSLSNAYEQIIRIPEISLSVIDGDGGDSANGSFSLMITSSSGDIKYELFSEKETIAADSNSAESIEWAEILGLYDAGDLDDVIQGYFGGFVYDPIDDATVGVKGYVQFSADSVMTTFDSSLSLESYPNINGDDWQGNFYIYDQITGGRSGYQSLSASVYHDGGGSVYIITSKSGLGHYFHGNFSSSGSMWVWDTYDGELWTTHYRKATSTRIQIADFVEPPTINNPYPDVYIIDVTRDDPIPLPGIISLLDPADGAETNSVKTILSWEQDDSTESYEIKIGTGSSCINSNSFQTSDTQWILTDLEKGGVYSWKVRGRNADDIAGDWSICRTFTAISKCNMAPITLLLKKRVEK